MSRCSQVGSKPNMRKCYFSLARPAEEGGRVWLVFDEPRCESSWWLFWALLEKHGIGYLEARDRCVIGYLQFA